jgi:signal transduction histidine kinase
MRRTLGRSLRLRLTVLTSGLLCVALVIGALALTSVLSASRISALDGIVAVRATTIASLAADDRVPPTLPVSEPGEISQLLDAEGRVVATSANASRTLPVVPPDVLAELRAEAQADGSRGAPLMRTTSLSAYDGQARLALVPTTYRGDPVTVVTTMPLGEIQALLRALSLALVVVVPVLTALVAWAVWLALGRALHPVEELRRAAAQVSRSGGTGALPVPARGDELAALASTLNEMLDRIEVGAARQRAFVADAAHELRSPITALRTSIEVAREHPDAYSGGELEAELEGEVLRMQALVDDLLLLAKVGSTPVRRTDTDLAQVATEAATLARATAAPRGGRPAVAVEVKGGGRAQADPAAIGRVVRNLVDNALRHASSRVCVVVSDASVVVDDDGAGIPPLDRDRVFERFVRLGDAREREAGGSGLGLAIAREIAREHGGDVTLEEAPAGGLRAVLTLRQAEPRSR